MRAQIPALLVTLMLSSCVSAPPPSAVERGAARRAISIQAFAGDEKGQLANSYLVSGSVDALLVDAQLDPGNARRLIEQIKASRKTLRKIFITHAHPDHHGGLETVLKAFPRAKAVSTRAVSEEIRRAGVRRNLVPEPLDKPEIEIEHEKARVLELGEPGESANAALLYLPSSRTVFCGDIVYSGVHLRIRETAPEQWMEAIEAFRRLGVDNPFVRILPGHGPPGDSGLIEENRRYLEAFLASVLPPASAERAVADMEKYYPDFRGRPFLEESVRSRLTSP